MNNLPWPIHSIHEMHRGFHSIKHPYHNELGDKVNRVNSISRKSLAIRKDVKFDNSIYELFICFRISLFSPLGLLVGLSKGYEVTGEIE
jgi:hypothetical protein